MADVDILIDPYALPGGIGTSATVRFTATDLAGKAIDVYRIDDDSGVVGTRSIAMGDEEVTIALTPNAELRPSSAWKVEVLHRGRRLSRALVILEASVDPLPLVDMLALPSLDPDDVITGLTQDEINAIHGAAAPGVDNVFATLGDVDSLIAAVKYHPASLTVDFGTLDSGTVADLAIPDGTVVAISEVPGSDALQVEITFADVASFKSVEFYGRYDGSNSHEMAMEVWDYNQAAWEQYGTVGNSDENSWYFWPVADPVNHVSAGAAKIRFRHLQNGNAGHDFFIDYLALDAVVQGTALAHSQLSGRSVEDQHPATAITVAATPVNYTPADATLEAHLAAIDAALGALA